MIKGMEGRVQLHVRGMCRHVREDGASMLAALHRDNQHLQGRVAHLEGELAARHAANAGHQSGEHCHGLLALVHCTLAAMKSYILMFMKTLVLDSYERLSA